jgi:hypothetical protein
MGAAAVVWSNSMVAEVRRVGLDLMLMDLSGILLDDVFKGLPKECHIDLLLETKEVFEGVKECVDIITSHLETQAFCHVPSWRQLIETWIDKGEHMRIRDFGDDGEDGDCTAFRAA